MSTSYVALLRGINVGGNNKLPMTDLRVMFAEVGCDDVRSYIQSGNVLFRATPALAARLPDLIPQQIAQRFGYRTPILLRTAEQLGDVIRANPFLAEAAAEETLHVLFLATSPSSREIATLDPDRSPPDTFAVRGPEIYLRLPHGVAGTKLTNAYFDSTLHTTSTGRNWRTVTKLLDLAGVQ